MKTLYVVSNLIGYSNETTMIRPLSVYLVVADNVEKAKELLYDWLYNTSKSSCIAPVYDPFLIRRNKVEVYLAVIDAISYIVDEPQDTVLEVKNRII